MLLLKLVPGAGSTGSGGMYGVPGVEPDEYFWTDALVPCAPAQACCAITSHGTCPGRSSNAQPKTLHRLLHETAALWSGRDATAINGGPARCKLRNLPKISPLRFTLSCLTNCPGSFTWTESEKGHAGLSGSLKGRPNHKLTNRLRAALPENS